MNSTIKTDNYINGKNKKNTKFKTFNDERGNKILNHFFTNTNILKKIILNINYLMKNI